MSQEETGISFKAPTDLYERFKAAADAEHRSVKGAFLNLMEERVAEFEDRVPAQSGKAA
ncbi:MAG TPA: hypothetical protein VI039_12995 [Solirubrobacterales bacterium]